MTQADGYYPRTLEGGDIMLYFKHEGSNRRCTELGIYQDMQTAEEHARELNLSLIGEPESLKSAIASYSDA